MGQNGLGEGEVEMATEREGRDWVGATFSAPVAEEEEEAGVLDCSESA